MVHSLGVAQPNVQVFLDTWNVPDVEKCVHAFVHKNGVAQTLPWNWRGWHAGKSATGKVSANNTHISFEICEPAGHTYNGGTMVGYDVERNAEYFAAVYKNAVELTAMLCQKYDLDPLADGVVICHSEGYQRGIASNHADVMHWFPKHGKSMDTFRADVAAQMKGETEMTQEKFDEMFAAAMKKYTDQMNARPVSDWAKEAWSKAVSRKVFDGSAPTSPLTREQAAITYDRMGLLD